MDKIAPKERIIRITTHPPTIETEDGIEGPKGRGFGYGLRFGGSGAGAPLILGKVSALRKERTLLKSVKRELKNVEAITTNVHMTNAIILAVLRKDRLLTLKIMAITV